VQEGEQQHDEVGQPREGAGAAAAADQVQDVNSLKASD
jgi:hypothetical protein